MAVDILMVIKILVIGCGPVGSTFISQLLMRDDIIITVCDHRITKYRGLYRWRNEADTPPNVRRKQVVTIQQSVYNDLPIEFVNNIFSVIDETVWPNSKNIPIKEYEDRCMDYINTFVTCGKLNIITEQITVDYLRHLCTGYDFIIGSDGGSSVVRQFMGFNSSDVGEEYALGLYYSSPRSNLNQLINCAITISQMRYLLNSSASRYGYLNIRLSNDELNRIRDIISNNETSSSIIRLLDDNIIGPIITDGCKLFSIDTSDIKEASLIRIGVTLNPPPYLLVNNKHHTFLIGDAYCKVHFWPGRGLNTGIKSAIALSHMLSSNNFLVDNIKISSFTTFMSMLLMREQCGRSLPTMAKHMDDVKSSVHICDDNTSTLNNNIMDALVLLGSRYQTPYDNNTIQSYYRQASSIIGRLDSYRKAELVASGKWPSTGGNEISVSRYFDLINNTPVNAVVVDNKRNIISSYNVCSDIFTSWSKYYEYLTNEHNKYIEKHRNST